MRLSDEEEAIAAGARGEGLQATLREQIAVGEFFGAERFVPVSNAHIQADWDVMGRGGTQRLQDLVAVGARAVVPSTRNPCAVDFAHADRLRQEPDLVRGEREVIALIRRLGIATIDTCVNYQTTYQPRPGEHVAWGDTGAVTYANSVLGARSNYESGPAALAAALTGRTPEYGPHVDARRMPTIRVVADGCGDDPADWGALGQIIGERLRDYEAVPLIEGIAAQPSSDCLKHLSASIASYGSIPLFHVAEVTPFDHDVPAGLPVLEIPRSQLEAQVHGGRAGDEVDVVVFTAPQLSLEEIGRIVGLLDGRRVADGVTLILTTSAMTRLAAHEAGHVDALEAAGAVLVQGTCWYLMAPGAMRQAFGWHRLATNSAKLANIVLSSGYETVLRRTEACVEAAITGRVPAS